MVGFHIWYTGYPVKDIVWIAFFVIDPSCQSRGFGQEVIRSFISWPRSGIFQTPTRGCPEKLASPSFLDKARI